MTKTCSFMFNVSFPLYYYTPLDFTLFLFDNVKKREKRDGCFCYFSGYQRHHNLNWKINGEICKIGGYIHDIGRIQVSSKNFPSMYFVIIKKGEIVKKICSSFFALFWWREKVILEDRSNNKKIGIKFVKVLDFDEIRS